MTQSMPRPRAPRQPTDQPDGDAALASSTLKSTRPTGAVTGPAASDPALPGVQPAAAQIVVVTAQDDFLLELGAVFASAAAVHPVASLDAALERIGALRCATVLVLDTRGMANLRNGVGRAFARAPAAAVLLFANAADEDGLRRMFKGSKVSAVLPIPMDSARTALAIAHALTDSRGIIPAAPVQTAPAPRSESSAGTPSRDRWGAGAAIAVLVLACAWFIARDKPAAVPSTAGAKLSPAAAPAQLLHGGVDAASASSLAATPQRSAVPSAPLPAGATVQVMSPTANASDDSAAPRLHLNLIQYVVPDYPAAARARGVTGSVTVAYTVNTQGATHRVRVVAAEPAGIFNRDAVEAVKRWRYAPVIVADAAVAVPARATIRFAPQ
jgi:TonB family protein